MKSLVTIIRSSRSASSRASREVELWEWRLEPGEVYPAEADFEGWSEQIYVFEGCLTLVIEARGLKRRLEGRVRTTTGIGSAPFTN